MARAFVDSNIFFYSVDATDLVKRQKAADLLRKLAVSREGSISPQVGSEFASNLMRKLRFTPQETEILCQGLHDFALVPATLDTLGQAFLLMRAASLSFWDACIVASALQGGCQILYTEDLNPGQVIAGVRIVNPFAA